MKIKNPIFFWLFVIFFFVNIVDTITTFFILKAESNPIYIFSGNIWIAIIFKFCVIGMIYYYHHRNIYISHFWYFVFIMIMVLGTLMVSLAVYSNITGIVNPEVLEEAAKIPEGERVKIYFMISGFIYFLPMGLSLLAFKFYELSLKYIIIDKKYFKKRKWYKL